MQRSGHRFINEDRQASFEYRTHLLQMNAAVNGLKKHNIDTTQDISNRINDLYSGVPDCGREFIQSITAFRDVAAARKRGGNST